MRHIPEDELHAYLDQGLSRTQCVEIESHLADCPSCQATRDGIAALRDRTTALLARLAPRRGVPPAFEVLQHRAADVADRRRRRVQTVAWAASLVAAVGIGWGGSSLARSAPTPAPAPGVASTQVPDTGGTARGATRVVAESISRETQRPARTALPTLATTPRPPARNAGAPASLAAVRARRPARRPPVVSAGAAADSTAVDPRVAALSVLNPTPALELSRLERPGGNGDLELGGMWRTMSWDGAQAEAGEPVPHIDGLPVMQVQVQNGAKGARPVMVVAQQLSSGQVIRTIEGPATDVSHLLSRRAMADVDSLFLPGDSNARSGDAGHAMAMQRGDRMLAITGDLPSDSLRAMIRRLNAEMRSK